MLGCAGELPQAAREAEEEEEKVDAEVEGGVKTWPEAVEEEEAEGAAAGNAEPETCRARRVSTARPGLGDLGRTMVETESGETGEEMERPLGERREEDLGICDNSPTNPGALVGGKS